jgi:hypothetical protein
VVTARAIFFGRLASTIKDSCVFRGWDLPQFNPALFSADVRRMARLEPGGEARPGIFSKCYNQTELPAVDHPFFASQRISCCRDVAQPGRALAWGARGRQFKSARPDHFLTSGNKTDQALTGDVCLNCRPTKHPKASAQEQSGCARIKACEGRPRALLAMLQICPSRPLPHMRNTCIPILIRGRVSELPTHEAPQGFCAGAKRMRTNKSVRGVRA